LTIFLVLAYSPGLRATSPEDNILPKGITIGTPAGVTIIMAMLVEVCCPEAV